MLTPAKKLRRCRLAVRRRDHPVRVPVEGDCRNADGWLRCEPFLEVFVGWVARRMAETMAVGVNDDVDVVRVVEGNGTSVESRVVKLPVGRVASPHQLRDVSSVRRQPGPSSFG